MSFAVVKGYALRVTKTDRCGKPLQGAANRLITEGFIKVNLDPNMKDATEITKENAAGKECINDRTPPERKWWNVSIDFCSVDPDLYALMASYTRILDHEGKPVGFRDRKSVDADSGVFIEVWTGGESDDDCPIPEDDSIFSVAGSGLSYGYLGFAANEFVSSAIPIEADATTFTLTGKSIAPKHWGRGPYNVAAIDANNTPGRLLLPIYDKDDDNHLALFRTPIAPPKPSGGACALAVQSIFTGTTKYFGASAADVAPDQPLCPAA